MRAANKNDHENDVIRWLQLLVGKESSRGGKIWVSGFSQKDPSSPFRISATIRVRSYAL